MGRHRRLSNRAPTDPLPSSALNIQGGTNALTLFWPAGIGTVLLQCSSNLINWNYADTQPSTNCMTFSISMGRGFFRLVRP